MSTSPSQSMAYGAPCACACGCGWGAQCAAAAAESAWRLATQRHEAGLTGYLTVLAAESAVLAQRAGTVELKARALDTQVALMRALGGGWRDDTPALASR